ncbi:MAG: hypothetical protein H0T60_06600 [Acidobacteria bacterium]|nr:hypothetical protein [Acidobacteriota bacterium]
MWLHSIIIGGRRPLRRAAGAVVRAALRATCLIGCAITSQAGGATGVTTSSALREKDVARAEKVLAKLRLLDEAAVSNDVRIYRALASKLLSGFFVTVADMNRSDFKTDLSTAVFLYEEVGQTWFAAGAATADCGRERQDIYLPLCLDLRGGTVRQLLVAKARLHARWAGAVVKNYKGESDAETSGAISEMNAARENDLVIAAHIVETLKPLEGLVNTPPTNTDYQERRTASKISFERLDVQLADALGIAGVLLNWMPRSPTFQYLSSARRSYMDGLFWYRKVHHSKKLVVSASGFERDPLEGLRMDAEQVGHAVIANWKSGMKYTRLAEQSLCRSARR